MTTTGPQETDRPARAGELPTVARIVNVEAVATTARAPEEDDQFQWFVDLFVAEYAAEAARGSG